MSVDLVIWDLARLSGTRIGHAPHSRVKGKNGAIGAVGAVVIYLRRTSAAGTVEVLSRWSHRGQTEFQVNLKLGLTPPARRPHRLVSGSFASRMLSEYIPPSFISSSKSALTGFPFIKPRSCSGSTRPPRRANVPGWSPTRPSASASSSCQPGRKLMAAAHRQAGHSTRQGKSRTVPAAPRKKAKGTR